MHRVCGIIHTDLKPENVVFALEERKYFEMLYQNVLCGPLIDLFESTTPIILNKKQLKNQKKKERKKEKKLEGKDKLDDKDDEKDELKDSNGPPLTKTEAIVNEFTIKI